MKCLSDLSKRKRTPALNLQTKNNYFKADVWKLNFNYWTAGMKNSCNATFSWCSGSIPNISALANDMTWDVSQPDNLGGNETCLHLKIPRNETEGVKLTDKNCNSKFIASCEVF